MENYHTREKDQPHIQAIAIDKFLLLWNTKLRQMGNGTFVLWLPTWKQPCATNCKPKTKKTRDNTNACVCLYRRVQITETFDRWPQWLRSGL